MSIQSSGCLIPPGPNSGISGYAPEEIFPENIWDNILECTAQIPNLRGVSRDFCDRIIPNAIRGRIEEFRSSPSAVPALSRFDLKIPEKNSSPADQLKFINSVYKTITTVLTVLDRRDYLLRTDDVSFFPYDVIKFFQNAYFRFYVRVMLNDHVCTRELSSAERDQLYFLVKFYEDSKFESPFLRTKSTEEMEQFLDSQVLTWNGLELGWKKLTDDWILSLFKKQSETPEVSTEFQEPPEKRRRFS